MEAFKPKKYLFLHCCANCEFAKKMSIVGSARVYSCKMEENRAELLAGCHICDVDIDKIGEQLTWFDELEEES